MAELTGTYAFIDGTGDYAELAITGLATGTISTELRGRGKPGAFKTRIVHESWTFAGDLGGG